MLGDVALSESRQIAFDPVEVLADRGCLRVQLHDPVGIAAFPHKPDCVILKRLQFRPDRTRQYLEEAEMRHAFPEELE